MNLESNAKGLMYLVGTGIVLFVAYKVYKGAGAVTETAKKVVTEDLNPASDKNVLYRQFNDTDAQGNVTASLGTKIYDAVDNVYHFLPFLESDKEKSDRLSAEARTRIEATRAAQNAKAVNYFDP